MTTGLKIAFVVFVGLIVIFFLIFFGILPGRREPPPPAVTLEFWGAGDAQNLWSGIITSYKETNPHVAIEYREIDEETYEEYLVNRLAENQGPDIFMLKNSWIEKHKDKISPLPQTPLNFFPKDFRRIFVDVTADDLVTSKSDILGLPLYVDTPALFYNKDMLNNAGILNPPKNWEEFKDAISRIAKRSSEDDTTLDQAGAAIGTANNVQRSFDILSTIMMQTGTQMVRGGEVNFDGLPPGYDDTAVAPGIDAVRFYTDFAYAGKEGIYTWNDSMPDSMEAFMQGRVAMVFGYSYHMQQIQSKAPQVNFGVVSIPQVDPNRPATSANYWIEGVSRKAAAKNYSWDFLNFITQEEQAKAYLERTGKPAALKSLVQQQLQNEILKPFATQATYAKSWYHGTNPALAESVFRDMINESLQSKGGRLSEERSRLQGIVVRARARINSEY